MVVRQGDDRFLNVVNWTIFALMEAEELGITSANVDARKPTMIREYKSCWVSYPVWGRS